ncbi:glucokinase, partial [Salmonella enterica]|uniref:glucokinase n=1 Tax=Salmonella enterica TaxID=28901 RepID=UPI00329A2BA3
MPDNVRPLVFTVRALADSCIVCRRALSLFFVILGRFGGVLALTMWTFGGVYIAVGIVPRFLEFFIAYGLRVGFEDN